MGVLEDFLEEVICALLLLQRWERGTGFCLRATEIKQLPSRMVTTMTTILCEVTVPRPLPC